MLQHIKLPGITVWFDTERNNAGTSEDDLQDDQRSEGYNGGIRGMIALIITQLEAGMDITTPEYRKMVEKATKKISETNS